MVKPKNSPYVLGIDLGTTNSTAAVYAKGESKVVPIDGQTVLPSVVHVNKDGEFIVGFPAKSQLLIDPDNTVASVKRELGNYSYAKTFNGRPGSSYSATDLSAEILTKICSGVEASSPFDLRGSLRYAVICIPANFDDAKKQATLEAGKMAGFKVLRLLEEPVAAAIAYAVEAKRDQKIIVYDLGGGTFDVSILDVDSTDSDEAQFHVLAKEGIPNLGGDDFDQAIMEIVAKDFAVKSDIDVFDLKKDQGLSRKTLRQAQQKLKEVAEAAKQELSFADSSDILLPNFLKDEAGTLHNIEYTITRTAFEHAIRDMLLSTRATMEKALTNAQLTIDDIARILLVGGSTKVPLVRQIVHDMFGREPYSDLDPATAVARGAAIAGAVLGTPDEDVEQTAETFAEDTPDIEIKITDIVTHFLGIEIVNGKFNKILDKGQEIPSDKPLVAHKDYIAPRDDMTEIRIAVYQAVDEPTFVTDKGCVCIGEFFLTGIPPRKRGEVKIDVSFEINQQNMLKVTANTKEQDGVANSLQIDRNNS